VPAPVPAPTATPEPITLPPQHGRALRAGPHAPCAARPPRELLHTCSSLGFDLKPAQSLGKGTRSPIVCLTQCWYQVSCCAHDPKVKMDRRQCLLQWQPPINAACVVQPVRQTHP